MTAYSFKLRFVGPIRAGLGTYEPILGLEPAIVHPKRQTIRSVGERRHARPGEIVQLYHAMRTKHCFKIGDGRCTETAPMIIWVNPETIAIERSKMMLSRPEMEQFAQADGFADAADMAAFWRKAHKGIEKFDGLLIKWEPIDG